MTGVYFHPDARAELDAAVNYYDKRRKGLGLDFLSVVERAKTRIGQNPLSFPLYQDTSIRRCVLRRFPYSLFFLPTDNVVRIIAIAHQKRKPDYWKHRALGS